MRLFLEHVIFTKSGLSSLLLWPIFLLLSSCSQTPDDSDYFPLQEGMRWEYRYQIDSGDQLEEGHFSMQNLGKASLGDLSATVRRTSDGTDYYVVQLDDGLYRYAQRTVVEIKPRMDEVPRMILPMLNTENKNRSWSSLTKAYTITRTGPNAELASENDTRFNMVYEVAEQGVEVTVPAGTFKNCLLVLGRAKISIYADPRIGFVEVDITTREWYAPGVGLVRLVREEPLKTFIFSGGSYTFELADFSY